MTIRLPLLWAADDVVAAASPLVAAPLVAPPLAAKPLHSISIPTPLVELLSIKSMCIVSYCFRGVL